ESACDGASSECDGRVEYRVVNQEPERKRRREPFPAAELRERERPTIRPLGVKPALVSDLLQQSNVLPVVFAFGLFAPDEIVEPDEGGLSATIASLFATRPQLRKRG